MDDIQIPDIPPGQWVMLGPNDKYCVYNNGLKYEVMWRNTETGLHMKSECTRKEFVPVIIENMEEHRIREEREDVEAFRNY